MRRTSKTEGCALLVATLVIQLLFFGLFYWVFKNLHAPTWAAFGFAYLITFRPTGSK